MGAALIIVQPRLVSMMAPGCHLSPCKVRGFLAGLVKPPVEINLEKFRTEPVCDTMAI
jgi:hypothetical protein